MPERDDYSKDIADQFSAAGLTMPPPDAPNPPPAPGPPPPQVGQAWLPKDVAARVAQQNATADTSSPQTVQPPPMAPQQVVRATPMAPQARPVQQGPAVPSGPSPLTQMRQAYDQQASATRDLTSAQLSQNEAQTTGDAQVAQLQREQAEGAAARAKEQQEQSARQLAEIHRLGNEAAAKKIDPDRWWHNQNTGAKVLYAISAALGGFAAGWTHTPNAALEDINRHIDHDIAAQRMDIEQAHGKVSDAKSVLAEMYNRYGNMDKAEAATKLLQINALTNDTKAQVAAAGSPAIEANGRLVLANLAQQRAMSEAKFMGAGQAKPIGFSEIGKYSDELGKAGIPEAEQGLSRVRDIANQDDPAGLGFLARKAHEHGLDFLLSQEGRNNNADIDQAVLKIAHATGRVTPQEVEAVRNAYVGSIGNKEAMRHFVDNVSAEIDAKKSNIQAGTDPRVVATQEALAGAYRRRGAPPAGLPPGSTP